jgi:hypothetical protein
MHESPTDRKFSQVALGGDLAPRSAGAAERMRTVTGMRRARPRIWLSDHRTHRNQPGQSPSASISTRP